MNLATEKHNSFQVVSLMYHKVKCKKLQTSLSLSPRIYWMAIEWFIFAKINLSKMRGLLFQAITFCLQKMIIRKHILFEVSYILSKVVNFSEVQFF